MAQKAISKMKLGKAAGPSNIVAELLKASGEIGIKLITGLANAMIRGEQAPWDWKRSFIVNCYKGKGDALLRGNYRGLKLLDQGMKVCERIINAILREQANIDSMQFGFMEGRGTTDAIFILRQLQEKHISADKNLYFAFVDLKKSFRPNTKAGHMVGYEKAWGTRMADTLGTESLQWSQKQRAHRRYMYLQRGIPSKSRGAPGISTKPLPLHHGPTSVVKGVPHRLSLGIVLRRRPCHHVQNPQRAPRKVEDVEERHGG